MRAIELSVEIQAPADKVWQALATAEGIARWFAPIVTGGTGVGDKLLFQWYPGGEFSGTVSAREEGRHLRWNGQTFVTDWFIEPQAGGVTIVRLVQSGWGDGEEWDDMYDATAGGFRYFMFNLRDYVEHHAGEPRTVLIDRRQTQESRPAAFNRVLANLPRGFRTVATEAPHRLWGTLPDYGDALVLVENEPGGDPYYHGIYVTLYGDARRYENELKPQLSRMLE
jgi:uncharacterized protein YndB with AHSA1/START domain